MKSFTKRQPSFSRTRWSSLSSNRENNKPNSYSNRRSFVKLANTSTALYSARKQRTFSPPSSMRTTTTRTTYKNEHCTTHVRANVPSIVSGPQRTYSDDIYDNFFDPMERNKMGRGRKGFLLAQSSIGSTAFFSSSVSSFSSGPSSSASSSSFKGDDVRSSSDERKRKPANPVSLRLESGAFVIPHPSKAYKGGEDAHFITPNAVGVADGKIVSFRTMNILY